MKTGTRIGSRNLKPQVARTPLLWRLLLLRARLRDARLALQDCASSRSVGQHVKREAQTERVRRGASAVGRGWEAPTRWPQRVLLLVVAFARAARSRLSSPSQRRRRRQPRPRTASSRQPSQPAFFFAAASSAASSRPPSPPPASPSASVPPSRRQLSPPRRAWRRRRGRQPSSLLPLRGGLERRPFRLGALAAAARSASARLAAAARSRLLVDNSLGGGLGLHGGGAAVGGSLAASGSLGDRSLRLRALHGGGAIGRLLVGSSLGGGLGSLHGGGAIGRLLVGGSLGGRSLRSSRFTAAARSAASLSAARLAADRSASSRFAAAAVGRLLVGGSLGGRSSASLSAARLAAIGQPSRRLRGRGFPLPPLSWQLRDPRRVRAARSRLRPRRRPSRRRRPPLRACWRGPGLRLRLVSLCLSNSSIFSARFFAAASSAFLRAMISAALEETFGPLSVSRRSTLSSMEPIAAAFVAGESVCPRARSKTPSPRRR